MEKIKNIPLVLLCLYGAKSLVLTPSLTDLGALAVLCAISMYLEYHNPNKKIKALEDQCSENQKDIKELKDMSESLKTNVSTIKLAQSYRQQGVK